MTTKAEESKTRSNLNYLFDNSSDLLMVSSLLFIFVEMPIYIWFFELNTAAGSFPETRTLFILFGLLLFPWILMCEVCPYFVRFACPNCGKTCKYSGQNKFYDPDYVRCLYRCENGHIHELN